MPKHYEFSVNLDDRYVRVVATDRLSASKQGANALGVVWRERARDMIIIQGREIRRKEPEKTVPSKRNDDAGSANKRDKKAASNQSGGNTGNQPVPTYKTGPLAGLPMKKGGR